MLMKCSSSQIRWFLTKNLRQRMPDCWALSSLWRRRMLVFGLCCHNLWHRELLPLRSAAHKKWRGRHFLVDLYLIYGYASGREIESKEWLLRHPPVFYFRVGKVHGSRYAGLIRRSASELPKVCLTSSYTRVECVRAAMLPRWANFAQKLPFWMVQAVL